MSYFPCKIDLQMVWQVESVCFVDCHKPCGQSGRTQGKESLNSAEQRPVETGDL